MDVRHRSNDIGLGKRGTNGEHAACKYHVGDAATAARLSKLHRGKFNVIFADSHVGGTAPELINTNESWYIRGY